MAGKGRPGPAKGTPRPLWTRVEKARQRMISRVDEAVDSMYLAAKEGARRGRPQAAAWILEHIETPDANGKMIRPIAEGIDRPQQVAGGAGPKVLIGIGFKPGDQTLPAVEIKELPQGQTESPENP